MIEWSISSSVLILVIITMRTLLRGKISLRLQYGLWLILLLRVLLPFSLIDTPLSIMNFLPTTNITSLSDTDIYVMPISSQPIGEEIIIDAVANELIDANSSGYAVLSKDGTTVTRYADKLTVQELLLLIWQAGIAIVALILLISNLSFYRKLRRIRIKFTTNQSKLRVYMVEKLPSPCLFGLIRPAIYITPDVAADEQKLNHVLAHELTHYNHGDHLWAALRGIAVAVAWFNPLVWLAATLSRRDAELACDEGVIARLGENQRLDYGRTLVGLVTARRGPIDLLSCATTMSGGKKTIKERIIMIAKKPHMTILTLVLVLIVAFTAVGCTFSGSTTEDEPADSGTVSDYAQQLYDNRNPYIGNASANSALLNALGISEKLGGFNMELDTDAEPYVLRLIFDDAITDAENFDSDMSDISMLLLALIDNASEIQWSYSYIDKLTQSEDVFTGKLNTNEATAALNGNIKDYGQSAQQIQGLLDIIALKSSGAYEHNGIIVPLPKDYEGKVGLTPANELADNNIIEAYHIPSREIHSDPEINFGFLFRIVRHTLAEFEDYWPMWDVVGGATHFAKDDKYYYSLKIATSVPWAEGYGDEYSALLQEVTSEIIPSMIEINGLQNYDHSLIYSAEYTYPGNHATVDFTISTGETWTLKLSQPVHQGENGIWCVERWIDNNGSLHIVMPETELTALEYYQQMQAECDNGNQPGLLDPKQVALTYITQVLGQNDQEITVNFM